MSRSVIIDGRHYVPDQKRRSDLVGRLEGLLREYHDRLSDGPLTTYATRKIATKHGFEDNERVAALHLLGARSGHDTDTNTYMWVMAGEPV